MCTCYNIHTVPSSSPQVTTPATKFSEGDVSMEGEPMRRSFFAKVHSLENTAQSKRLQNPLAVQSPICITQFRDQELQVHISPLIV